MKDNELLPYLAGFFDGEGCIRFWTTKEPKTGKTYRGLGVCVSQLSPEPLNLLMDTFEVGRICSWVNAAGNLQHQWSVSGDGAEKVIRGLLPYLRVKKPQALVAIRFQERSWKGLSKKTPEQFIAEENMAIEITRLKRPQVTN